MAQTMFHESGPEGRSVLGMVEVQVERDPKTGTTVIRSVVPVSTPVGAPEADAVFDDGRKTIHAVGGSGGRPSTEEIGQILSAVDGVGMKVLLDEVTANNTGTKTENTDARTVTQEKHFFTHQATSKEDTQLESCRSYKVGTESCAVSVDNKEPRSTVVVRDAAAEVQTVEDQGLEQGPVTMVFLGYTDATAGQNPEDHQGELTVERVIITEEGEEQVLGAETPEAGTASQRLHPDGNGAGLKVPSEDGDNQKSHAASAAEGGRSCQCCSVM
ncbi:hypothetical protein Q5P01_017802 [Channa striata]|uniref:Paralemmin n=1 Tax=Channa striata TaxID=64152 RepID=A0AA88MAY3_CHASR|nr:hypothetical protein Q5P01_017802 [Channa striata]